MNPLVQVVQSIRKNGVRKTTSAIVDYAVHVISPRSSFDEARRVDTDKLVSVSHLSPYAIRYQPSSEEMFAEVLGKIGNPSRYTFIDYGCGKGRILILASKEGFREVIGVEFCEELVNIARRNLMVSKSTAKIVACDAATYRPPVDVRSICYLYHPFNPPILDAVAAKLKRIPTTVFYSGPHLDSWREFRLVGNTTNFHIFIAPFNGYESALGSRNSTDVHFR